MEIKGHSAIVTGGASGLGAATARALAAAGAKVAIFDVNEKAAAEVAIDIKGIALTCDVADSASAEAAVKKAAADHGPARILINCAGVGPAKRIVGRDGPMPLADYERVIRINLIGTFNMMRLAAAAMQPLDAARRRRARRHRLDRLGRRLRGPDRPGGLRVVEGRRRRADAAGGARIRPVRRPRDRHRARHFRHADAARAAAGSARFARRLGAVPQAARRAARIRRAGHALRPQHAISTAR